MDHEVVRRCEAKSGVSQDGLERLESMPARRLTFALPDEAQQEVELQDESESASCSVEREAGVATHESPGGEAAGGRGGRESAGAVARRRDGEAGHLTHTMTVAGPAGGARQYVLDRGKREREREEESRTNR